MIKTNFNENQFQLWSANEWSKLNCIYKKKYEFIVPVCLTSLQSALPSIVIKSIENLPKFKTL